MDVRKSLSAMWQLIATFCHYANSTLLEVLDEFANTPLISSKLIPEELLRTQTLTALNNAHQTALDGVNQSITFADRITQASGLMTGLATNAVIGLPINVWQSEQIVPTFSTKYKRHESTTLCYCINDVSCPMPGGLYFYDEWETNGIYDLNVIVPNATIPGLVVDCLPTQTMFASTVECFYNQSCLDILLSAYQADLPARALATKHVHHNGYYACLKCIKRRVWCEKGRIVTYPYNQNSSSLRTSPHINVCATLVLHENKCHQGIILV
ncbi:unnamed protein product [Adineta steineri]|uniref:Uncharacterized protein n=1 Tax=Adineta steineri TaxID=433720 RepID=A0A814M818_9BILA|nr:unnamed protein product [Adineta steineri]